MPYWYILHYSVGYLYSSYQGFVSPCWWFPLCLLGELRVFVSGNSSYYIRTGKSKLNKPGLETGEKTWAMNIVNYTNCSLQFLHKC